MKSRRRMDPELALDGGRQTASAGWGAAATDFQARSEVPGAVDQLEPAGLLPLASLDDEGARLERDLGHLLDASALQVSPPRGVLLRLVHTTPAVSRSGAAADPGRQDAERSLVPARERRLPHPTVRALDEDPHLAGQLFVHRAADAGVPTSAQARQGPRQVCPSVCTSPARSPDVASLDPVKVSVKDMVIEQVVAQSQIALQGASDPQLLSPQRSAEPQGAAEKLEGGQSRGTKGRRLGTHSWGEHDDQRDTVSSKVLSRRGETLVRQARIRVRAVLRRGHVVAAPLKATEELRPGGACAEGVEAPVSRPAAIAREHFRVVVAGAEDDHLGHVPLRIERRNG